MLILANCLYLYNDIYSGQKFQSAGQDYSIRSPLTAIDGNSSGSNCAASTTLSCVLCRLSKLLSGVCLTGWRAGNAVYIALPSLGSLQIDQRSTANAVTSKVRPWGCSQVAISAQKTIDLWISCGKPLESLGIAKHKI